MTLYRFEVPGCPVPWQRVKRGRNGHAYVPPETRSYKLKVGLCARTAGVRKASGDVTLTLALYFPDKRRRDGENVQKAIQDALNGIAWEDDSQVKFWNGAIFIDKDRPRAVVTVEAQS